MKRAALILAAAALLVGVWLGVGRSGGSRVTIIYSGATFGKLTPCGCSDESDLGGLLRRDTALAALRAAYPDALVLDAGGNFKEATEEGKLGAAAVVDSLAALGYDAVAIGAGDLLYGRDFLAQRARAGLFASNLTFKKSIANAGVVREFSRSDVRVRVMALIDPSDVYTGAQADIDVAPIADFVAGQPADGALTVALVSTTREKAQRVSRETSIEVTIDADPTGDLLHEPIFTWEGGKVYVEAGIFGSRIGVLELEIEDGRIITATNRFVALDKSYADGPRVKPIYEAYEAETKKRFLAALAGKGAYDREASPFTGSEACRACHAKAFGGWENSGHARAWESLTRVGATFDPECVACHVVGWEQAGGFQSEAESPHLTGVGCEACHGPGKAHVESKGKSREGLRRSSLNECLACHNAERAPAFDAAEAWPKIAH